ncbi:MAG: NACHT domain-containing protein [Pseudomonadota bacterium]
MKEAINNQHLREKASLFSSQAADAVYGVQHVLQQKAIPLTIDNQLPLAANNEEEQTCNETSEVLGLIEKWVLEGTQPYGALLGEYGMGKTTTCMLFTHYCLEQRNVNPSLPLPIYIDLRNIGDKTHCNNLSLTEIIDAVIKNNQYDISENIIHASDVINLVEHENVLIIFDSLDEILVNLTAAAGREFTHRLLSILPAGNPSSSKVLLSCRTHYFRTVYDQEQYFVGEWGTFMLLPLIREQIFEYLSYALPDFNTSTLLNLIQSVHNLSEFSERPYTLSLIPDLIPYIDQWKKEGSLITGATIYRHMILSWLERDAGRHLLTIDHKQQLMELFAAELWKSGKQVWNIQDVESWFVHLLNLKPEIKEHYTLGKDSLFLNQLLDMLKGDLRAATFLVRIGNNFCFAHTSLQEFFLAAYLHRALLENRIEAWNLALVSQETLDFLGQLISEDEDNDLTTALKSLSMIRDTYRPQVSELGFAYMLLAYRKNFPTPSLEKIHLEGANLAGWIIEGKEREVASQELLNLSKASFQRANLKGATLRYINLKEADFSEADCTDVEFTFCEAISTCFEKTNLRAAFLMDMQFQKANFSSAQLHYIEWVRCNLENTIGLEFSNIPLTTVFDLCEPSSVFNYEHRKYSEGKDTNVHQALIVTCKFSPDSHHIASASVDGTLRIWNLKTRKCVRLFKHRGLVLDCAFSPDGSRVVAAVSDKTLHIWDIQTGESAGILIGHQKGARSCAFLANNEHLISTSDDTTIRVWNVSSEECTHILNDHQYPIRGCAISPLGHQFASASDDKTVRLWDTKTKECLKVFKGHTDWVRKCVFSVSGRQLISASGDKTLRIWDIETGECLNILKGHENKVRGCAVSPDGKHLVSASYDHTLRVWDLATGECLNVLKGHDNRVRGCDFSLDGRLASASDDLTLRIWDIQSGECLSIIGAIKYPVSHYYKYKDLLQYKWGYLLLN